MIREHLSLVEILDMNQFQSMQDNLSVSTDLALLTVDYKGIPVTTHSSCRSFCEKIRKIPHYKDLCQKCDSRGGLEAARLQKPYIYICHMGIVDLAVPIIAEDQYLGAMMAGQVRISDSSKLEWILNANHDTEKCKANKELVDDYYAMPELSFEKIEAIGNLLFGISKVIVDRATLLRKPEDSLVERHLRESQHQQLSQYEQQSQSRQMGQNAQQFQNPYLSQNTQHLISKKTAIRTEIPTQYIFLKPAIEYLHQHCDQKIYLKDMATLCSISESYFSKSFHKAFGMSFTLYQNKLRIEKSEKLLRNTSKNINQISDELGFDHASYFIRLFKKIVGLTPSMYKQLYIEKTQVEHENAFTAL